MREAEIQRRLIPKLEAAGWMVVKIIQCTANGFPDLMCLRAAKAVFIEVKRPGEKPRPLQEYRIKKLRDQGFEVIVAVEEKDIAHILLSHEPTVDRSVQVSK